MANRKKRGEAVYDFDGTISSNGITVYRTPAFIKNKQGRRLYLEDPEVEGRGRFEQVEGVRELNENIKSNKRRYQKDPTRNFTRRHPR